MQDIKIYIVIENKKTGEETNISGSLELLRAFLSGVGSLEIQPTPTDAQIIPHKTRKSAAQSLTKQEGNHATH
ncbi:MAG: hypothetical protein IT310_15325 [Anaerolineales bacterium]|nr:hypothetical protein [Anaerolineales bacterium]